VGDYRAFSVFFLFLVYVGVFLCVLGFGFLVFWWGVLGVFMCFRRFHMYGMSVLPYLYKG